MQSVRSRSKIHSISCHCNNFGAILAAAGSLRLPSKRQSASTYTSAPAHPFTAMRSSTVQRDSALDSFRLQLPNFAAFLVSGSPSHRRNFKSTWVTPFHTRRPLCHIRYFARRFVFHRRRTALPDPCAFDVQLSTALPPVTSHFLRWSPVARRSPLSIGRLPSLATARSRRLQSMAPLSKENAPEQQRAQMR